MNTTPVTNLLKAAGRFTAKNTPQILMGLGITLAGTTTVLAVSETPKALKLIEEAKQKRNAELRNEAIENGHEEYAIVEQLPVKDVIKVTWKCYIPAAATGALAIACFIGSSKVSARRSAALLTAFTLSETAFSDYKKKVIETIGEKKEKVVREEIAKEKLAKDPVENHQVIITGNGNVLCYDAVFGQYFESNMETIKKAVNNINYQMLGTEYASLNDFYDELGIPHIDIGNMMGWNIGKQGKVEIDYTSQISSDGRPCIVIQYNVVPDYNYDRFI